MQQQHQNVVRTKTYATCCRQVVTDSFTSLWCPLCYQSTHAPTKKKICQFFYITFHLTSAQSFASVYTLITILSRPIKMQGLCCPLYDIIDMQGSSPLTRSRLVMRLWKKLIPASETVTLAQNLLKHVMTSTQGFLTVLGRLFHSNLNRSRYMYPVDN